MPMTRAPVELGELGGEAAGGAGGGTDDDGVALLDLADLEHPDVGRHAGRAVDGEVGLLVDLVAVADVGDEDVVGQGDVALPPGEGGGDVAELVVGRVGGDHPAAAGAAHHLADLDGREVPLALLEPASDGGVDADPLGLDEDPTRRHLRHRQVHQLHVLVAQQPDRAGPQHHPLVPSLLLPHEAWNLLPPGSVAVHHADGLPHRLVARPAPLGAPPPSGAPLGSRFRDRFVRVRKRTSDLSDLPDPGGPRLTSARRSWRSSCSCWSSSS